MLQSHTASMCHQQWVELGGRVLAAQAMDPVFHSQQLLAFSFPPNLPHNIKLKDVMTGKFAYLPIKCQQVIKVGLFMHKHIETTYTLLRYKVAHATFSIDHSHMVPTRE